MCTRVAPVASLQRLLTLLVAPRSRPSPLRLRRTKDNHAITDAILQAIESPSHAGSLPFELIMLEVLLHVTSFYFDRRISHLAWMIDTLLGDMAQVGARSWSKPLLPPPPPGQGRGGRGQRGQCAAVCSARACARRE